VAWHSGRTSVSGRRTFPVLRSTCSWWVTTKVGKPSASGQPTRLTQAFHPFWVDKLSSKLKSDVCCRLQVAPSGESYEGNRRGSLLPVLWRDSLHVTCGLTACTPESGPGPTLGDEYGKTTFFTWFLGPTWDWTQTASAIWIGVSNFAGLASVPNTHRWTDTHRPCHSLCSNGTYLWFSCDAAQ